MLSRAAVLTAFAHPLEIREFPFTPLAKGEVRVRVRAAGVCGSDVHIWRGRDPRTPLPLILGHEGIGEVEETSGPKFDVHGSELKPGDQVVWERGIVCGQCVYCVLHKQPALCLHRKTYGISVGCSSAPHLRGAYAEYIHLMADTHLIKVGVDVPPAILAIATCAGATAAHAIEQANMRRGDTVLLIGPGPMAIFATALARASGAGRIIVFGTERSASRLAMAQHVGADETLVTDGTSLEDRVAFVRSRTQGLGAQVVIECAGTVSAVEEAIQHTAACGVCLLPGVATPIGRASISVFEHIARRNVRVQGVWVSDASHLEQALRLAVENRTSFADLVTHRVPLDGANEALAAVESRSAVKAVIEPWGDG